MKKQKDPHKKTKKKIDEFLESLEFFTSTQNYDKGIVYKKEDDSGKLAEISVEKNYQRVTLSIYPAFFRESPDEQRNTLIHEGVHILLAPIQYKGTDMLNGNLVTKDSFIFSLEESTSKVTEVLVRLLDGKLKYMAKAYKDYLK